jgi:CRISPR/Cas system CMR-associated protein Cmr3 (group 5 of RAMP superfamily)
MQAAQQTENLIRKQLMLSNSNIEKLEKIAKEKKLSVASVVRSAIDSFNPDNTNIETSELMELVSSRLKETIEDTANTRKRLDKTLTSLEQRGVL